MIQRIQSLYLAIAAIVAGLIFLFPIGQILVIDGVYEFSVMSLDLVKEGQSESVSSFILPAILNGLVIVGSILSIFLYANRKTQIRVIQVVMLTNIALVAAIFYYQKEAEKLAGALVHYKFGIIFPILSLVFLILAIRSIRKDEELVRAADRLR